MPGEPHDADRSLRSRLADALLSRTRRRETSSTAAWLLCSDVARDILRVLDDETAERVVAVAEEGGG